ncbi:MAG TPA: hypothetical protein VM694_21840 [Polyangium sp.]|nr:hypothetical protein [Polyangium sp.]
MRLLPSTSKTAARVALSSLLLAACEAPRSSPVDARPPEVVIEDAGPEPIVDAAFDVEPKREIGPFEIPFLGKRAVFFARPSERAKGHRLIANLHGVCNPPGYACGYWVNAASRVGFLVCPTGDATCGKAAYDAPTWSGSYEKMGEDLEKAIVVVDTAHPGEITREGAILTGFSRGAYAAARIAQVHPGRWPYLVLNEADVQLDGAVLRKAGVRAVAMIAGERSGQVAGERATVAKLVAQGYPAKLWVMPGAGHHYSDNIDEIMAEAMAWLLER